MSAETIVTLIIGILTIAVSIGGSYLMTAVRQARSEGTLTEAVKTLQKQSQIDSGKLDRLLEALAKLPCSARDERTKAMEKRLENAEGAILDLQAEVQELRGRLTEHLARQTP